ncbi:hypothetical protein WA588_006478, partial [Blastocystis sp. NMH]
MKEQYTWYECSYPGVSYPYFVNVKTGVAVLNVPSDDPDALSVKEFDVDTDPFDDFPYYCCRVNREFVKESPNEITLREGEIVFVKSLLVGQWVFVESLEGKEGYAPFFCLDSIQLPQPKGTPDSSDPSYYLPQTPTNPDAATAFGSPMEDLPAEDTSIHSNRHSRHLSFSSVMSQTDTSTNRLISLTLPLFIRKTFDNTPVLPFDIWTIEFARSTLQLPSNQFNSILKDCGVNPANFAELLEAMGITALSRPACVPLSVSDSLYSASSIYHSVRHHSLRKSASLAAEETEKVAKEGDGVIKVAKEGDGVIKVAKEDDGAAKVFKETDNATKGSMMTDKVTKVSKEANNTTKISKEADNSIAFMQTGNATKTSQEPQKAAAPQPGEPPSLLPHELMRDLSMQSLREPAAPAVPSETPISQPSSSTHAATTANKATLAAETVAEAAPPSAEPNEDANRPLASNAPATTLPQETSPATLTASMCSQEAPSFFPTPGSPVFEAAEGKEPLHSGRLSLHTPFPLEQPPRGPELFVDLNDYTFLAYASIYFQREKTRLFHSSTLQELITFSSQVPIQPLHRGMNARVNSVLEVERKVLMFINAIAQEAGDSEFSSENSDLLEQICFQSLTSQEMFDEIVCFVIKETNGNPSEESQRLAFHLLFVLLSQRRPSSHLLHYIVYYIYLQLSQSGAIGGLAVSIMRVLLSDDLRFVDGTYSIQRFQWVCDESKKATTSAFCSSLFGGTSIESINLTEEVAELLLRHGIMPPTDNSYGIDIELPSVATQDYDIPQMLSAFQAGVVLHVRTADSKDFKERIVMLDPTLRSLHWMSTNPAKSRLRSLYLSDVNSVVLIGDPFRDGGVERNTLYGVKLFTMEEEKAVDLAVISPPEQQRLKQFLNLLIKWYKLNSKEIQELHAKYVVPDDGTDEDGGDEHEFCLEMKRWFRSYVQEQPLTPISLRYSTLQEAQTSSLVHTSRSLLSSPAGSLNSPSGSLQRRTATGSKGLDFQRIHVNALDALKRADLTASRPRDAVALMDIMPLHRHDGIPKLLLVIVQSFVDREAYKEEGIFRISAEADRKRKLLTELGLGNYGAIQGESPYMIADVIKSFMRNLSPRLVPSSLYMRIVTAGKKGKNVDLNEVWEIMHAIPPTNFKVLMYLLTLLYKVSLVKSNIMTISNLCTCCAVNLVSAEGSDIERELEYISDVNMFFQVVLNSLPDYFDVSVYGE